MSSANLTFIDRWLYMKMNGMSALHPISVISGRIWAKQNLSLGQSYHADVNKHQLFVTSCLTDVCSGVHFLSSLVYLLVI